MSETIRVLIPEEEVDKKIRELGEKISEDMPESRFILSVC